MFYSETKLNKLFPDWKNDLSIVPRSLPDSFERPQPCHFFIKERDRITLPRFWKPAEELQDALYSETEIIINEPETIDIEFNGSL